MYEAESKCNIDASGKQSRMQCRQRPYCDEYTRSHPNSAVKHHKARSVLGWGTAWEALRVPLAFSHVLVLGNSLTVSYVTCFSLPITVDCEKIQLQFQSQHPTVSTLQPAPCSQHPTVSTLQSAPYTLQSAPYSQHPVVSPYRHPAESAPCSKHRF